jgi:diguanylate cyclase (GGDEF)-like protein
MNQLDATCEDETNARAYTGAQIVMRAAEQRKRAAQQRARAADQRASSADDRQAAARDRQAAARDRLQARTDREALAAQLAISATDPLTGARTRRAGLTDLDHELERCRRTSGMLVVAYVDVIGLKRVNDAQGHPAGDQLLKRVVALITTHLRPYDLVIRLGGDEFLCAMSNISLAHARQRFGAIAAALAASPDAGAIRAGFAQLTPGEEAEDLVARADKELVERRHR